EILGSARARIVESCGAKETLGRRKRLVPSVEEPERRRAKGSCLAARAGVRDGADRAGTVAGELRGGRPDRPFGVGREVIDDLVAGGDVVGRSGRDRIRGGGGSH